MSKIDTEIDKIAERYQLEREEIEDYLEGCNSEDEKETGWRIISKEKKKNWEHGMIGMKTTKMMICPLSCSIKTVMTRPEDL
jgi:hypothetical protein